MPLFSEKQANEIADKIIGNVYRQYLWKRIGYKPYPKQMQIFNAIDSGARFIDVVAGTRSGKTITAAAVAVEKLSYRPPKNVPLGVIPIIAPYGRLTEKAFRWIWRWVVDENCLGTKPIKAANSPQDRYIEMPWGMRVEGLTADNPTNLKGEGWIFVILDEYAEFKPGIYESHVERGLMDCLAPVMRVSTPMGQANHWCASWQDTHNQMIDGDKEYFASVFTAYDNPFLPDGEVARAEAKYKRQGLEPLFRSEFLGEFIALQGALYPNFQETRNGLPWHVDDVDPLPGVPFDIGVDWGTDHPAVAVFCQVFGDRINVCDMIYQTGMTDAEFADAVKSKCDWWSDVNGIEVRGSTQKKRNVKFCYCDPSDPGGKKEFRNAGLPVYTQPSGIESKINDRMFAPRILLEMFGREDKPAVRIDRSRCKPLIFQLHNMIYGTDEKPKKQDRIKHAGEGMNYTGDDAHDSFRYVVGGAIGQARTVPFYVGSF